MTASAPSLSPNRWWILLWLGLGTLHLTQSIWFSGFDAIPGDLGDGRFNQLVLEHGTQSLLGHYDWLSPGQFHPTTGTLGWSDTHLGTLPFYALPRLMGFGPEAAMQVWFILCAGLNLVAGYQLLRRLGADSNWAAPLSFVAFAGAPVVWMSNIHAQMLPVFPALWAGGQLLSAWQQRSGQRLFLAAGAMGWQFACGPYLAFFAGVILAIAVVASALLRSQRSTADSLLLGQPRVRPWLIWAALLGLVAGAINIWVYLGSVRSGVGRPMQEVIDLAPKWISWISAPPAHAWFPTAWPGGSTEHSEHVLFGGFLPWIGTLFALFWCSRRRDCQIARTALLCSASATLALLFFTTWPGGFSPWILLAEKLEPLRGFRAAGRSVILIHALMATATGLVLVALAKSGWRRFAMVGCAALLAETLVLNPPHFEVQDAQARREAMVAAWQDAADRPILAFAPGFTNQPMPHQNLDAWAAALSLQRSTLNGYTGGAPNTHLPFLWTPTEAEARGVMHLLKIPETDVSIVTGFPPETASRLGYEIQTRRPLPRLQGFDVQPADWELFSPLEHFTYDEIDHYQFTPPATVSFRIPPGITTATFRIGLRPGAYQQGGDSDGFELTWTVTTADKRKLAHGTRVMNPRDEAADRGFHLMEIELPSDSTGTRLLTLRFGPGPSGLTNWDWPLLAALKLQSAD